MTFQSFSAKTLQKSLTPKAVIKLPKPIKLPKGPLFRITDASEDNSLKEVFEDGAIKISYNNAELRQMAGISGVNATLTATHQGSGQNIDLGSKKIDLNNNHFLFNLKDQIDVQGFTNRQDWTIDVSFATTPVVTRGSNNLPLIEPGRVLETVRESITVINPLNSMWGDATANTFQYQDIGSSLGSGRIYLGRGGTDTLVLEGIHSNQITSLNGSTRLSGRMASLGQQALYAGSAFDVVGLANGDEIYLQGIERLQFTDRVIALSNDVSNSSKDQWNLQAMDVHGAWRFTKGSNDVKLISLDTGLGDITGNDSDQHSELWNTINQTSKNNFASIGNRDHGHRAMSVMGARHDGQNLAGVSPNNPIHAYNVYDNGVSLYSAIEDAKNQRSDHQRLVFQGGIQGASWWSDGATREAMQTALDETAEYGFFAIAAGNGGPGGGFTSEVNYLTSVSGVAQAESTNSNIASIGALKSTGTEVVDGLTNATGVQLAAYSNRGDNLTLVGTTDTKSINADGVIGTFTGTSAANPNVAAVAALVWSENTGLTGSELRDILTSSAMDLGDTGRDNTFGFGLVNAEAAVRRAYALGENQELANFWNTDSFMA